MVKRVRRVTALGSSGVADWLIQRISAVILLVYLLFLLGFYLIHPTINFDAWHGLFAHTAVRMASLLALLALLSHAWIGIWTVLTDYVKVPAVRGTIQIIIILGCFTCLAWGIQILWS